MRDRFPLLVLAAVLFLAGASWFLAQAARRGGFAEPLSTHRSEPNGARALFLLARQGHVPVEKRHIDLRDLEPGEGTLVLLGIERLPTPEIERVQKFVKEGGRLVLVVGPGEAKPDQRPHGTPAPKPQHSEKEDKPENGESLLDSLLGSQQSILEAFDLALEPAEDRVRERVLEVATPSALTWGVERVETRVGGYLLHDGAAATALLTDPSEDDRAVAVALTYESGKVVAIAAPDLASNRVLGRADNARLWLSLLAALARADRVQFDEYHHGFTGERSISGYAAQYGLHWALLQLLLGVWLWTAALKRFGRAKAAAEGEEQRGQQADYLLAMARIYRQGQHRLHAARLHVQGLVRALARQTGAPPDGVQVAAALERQGRSELAHGLREALVQAESSPSSDHQLLALAARCVALRRSAEGARLSPRADDPPSRASPRTPEPAPRADASPTPSPRSPT